jgi:hypothetical protein
VEVRLMDCHHRGIARVIEHFAASADEQIRRQIRARK